MKAVSRIGRAVMASCAANDVADPAALAEMLPGETPGEWMMRLAKPTASEQSESATVHDAVQVLTPWVRDFVGAVREQSRASHDMVLGCVLGALSSAIQRTVTVIHPDGHRSPVGLYVCVVALPGSRKSSVLDRATAPIHRWVEEKREAEFNDIQLAQIEYDRTEDAYKKAVASHEIGLQSADVPPETADMLRMARELEEPRPVHFDFITENATVEALHKMLDEQRHAACISDEGSTVFGGFTRYAGRGQGPDLSIWLKAYDGKAVRFQRVQRKTSRETSVERSGVTLSSVLGIQPSVLASVAGDTAMSGQGFTARFAWVDCSGVGVRLDGPDDTPTPVPAHVDDCYGKSVASMLALDPRELRLASNAQGAYNAWRYELMCRGDKGRRAADLAENEALLGWASKHLDRTLRIAAGLWATDGASGVTITAEQFDRAVTIARWMVPHARKALGGRVLSANAQVVLERIRLDGPSPKSHLHKFAPTTPMRENVKIFEPLLQSLVDQGWARLVSRRYALTTAGEAALRE